VIAEREARAAEQGEAIASKEAEKDRDAAELDKREEEIAHKEADERRVQAEIAQQNEFKARQETEKAKEREEYEAYIAEIGLAAAKINDNAFDFARELLEQSKPELRNWEWGRLMHLTQLGEANFPAGAPVEAVAYSPDGEWFVSGDMVGKVTVRNARTGEVRFQAPHGQYVLSVAYSHDGKKIASGSSDHTIHIWDAANGQLLTTLRGHEDGVLSVRFSPDGTQLLSGSYDNTARLWDLATGRVVQELRGHSWWVWAAEFSPDGRRIVTAGQDGKAIVWEKVEGSELRVQGSEVMRGSPDLVVRGSPDPAPVVRGSPDPARVPTAGLLFGEQGSPSVSSVARSGDRPQLVYMQLTEFTGHNGAVYSARFSPNGELVATGGYDKLVMIWNPNEAQSVDIDRRLNGEPDPKTNYLRLEGHDKPVRCVAFSPNGELVLSGSEDNAIRVWDVANGESRKVLRGHGSAVRSCAFSPNGQSVLSGSEDQSVRVWNIAGYQETRVLHAKVLSGHADAVLSARFSRDGRQIITASRDRTAALWDATSGMPLRQFQEGHEFLVSGAAFVPDASGKAPTRLATGAGDNSVRIWDVTAGTELAVLTSTGRNGVVAVSPGGAWLATGSQGTDVKVWSLETLEQMATLSGHEEDVAALAFSPDGQRLATGDERGVVRVWVKQGATQRVPGGEQGAGKTQDTPVVRRSLDPARDVVRGSPDPAHVDSPEWELQHELTGHNGSITALRFTPDGRRLVVASGDNTCGQWDVATGRELRELVLKHPAWVSSLDISADGTRALTTCDDGSARLWRLADAAEIASVQSPGKPFNHVAYSPDGSMAVLTSAEDKLVYVWDLSAEVGSGFRVQRPRQQHLNPEPRSRRGDNPFLRPLLDFNQLGGEVWAAIFAPDGRHLLSIGGNDAQLWNTGTRTPVVRYSPHGAVASAALSPDGRFVATGSWDHSAKIWDAASGRALRKLSGGHTGYINAVDFSLNPADGSRLELLTASDDGTARLWDVESGQPTGVIFRGHSGRISCASFSPDGSRVLTAGGDKTARVWDRATGHQIRALTGHQWAVLCVQFSPDGQRVITGSEDDTAMIWNLAGGEPIKLGGHTAAITAVAFSPDGTRVLTGSRDNAAKLWDARTGKEILSLAGHTQEVTSVGFSPDGLHVLTASRDGTAILWLARDWRSGEHGAGSVPFLSVKPPIASRVIVGRSHSSLR
jgi:hypothetical protein